MKTKQMLAFLTGAAISASVTIPVMASEITANPVNLTKNDVTITYAYSKLTLNSGTITLGDAITNGSDFNKVQNNMMDGNVTTTARIGANGNNNRCIIVDLGENRVSDIKVENITTCSVVGLTNSISTTKDSSFNLDYAKRVNNTTVNSNHYNPNSLEIALATGTNDNGTPEDASDDYNYYTLSGDDIKNYRYVVIHNNGSTADIGELTLSYTPIPSETAVASAVVEGKTKYYDNISEAVTNADANSTVTLLKDVTLSSRLNINKNLTITSNNKTITGNASPAAVLVNGGKSVTFENTNITDSDTSSNNALAVSNTNSKVTVKGGTVTGNIYQENGTNTAITLNNVIVNGNILTRKGKDKDSVNNTACTIAITNSTVSGTLTYYSTVDAEPSVTDSTITGGIVNSNKPSEIITMTPSFVGSYTGDNDNSTAVAYTATFTSTTGDTASFNIGNITWKLNNEVLTVTENNVTNNVTITLSEEANVVYGVIIANAADEGVLSAEFN